MKRGFRSLPALVLVGIGLLAVATGAPAGKGDDGSQAGNGDDSPSQPEKSVTEHQIEVDGQTLAYSATAGKFVLRNDDDEPIAHFGYTAYTKNGVSSKAKRPITFAYNGGPGSSSIWLHMGALGPRRIVTADAEHTPPPPYEVVDNAHTILDRTDLVMIDPVGTGLSRPAGEASGEDFWGVDQDIESVARFIKQYVSANGRWHSPKYLLGESYGTMRSAGVVDHLQTEANMAFNGVILVSSFLDARTAIPFGGNDLAYIMYLPTFAAVAHYHDELGDDVPGDLDTLLQEAEQFAMGDYADALMQGDKLGDARRESVIERMAGFTGLSEAYLDRANLRVTVQEFTKELLRDAGETVGRLDSRFTGTSFDLLGQNATYDPMSASVGAAFTAAFMHYYHQELEFGQDERYIVTNDKLFPKWEFKHQPPNAPFKLPGLPNTGIDLAHAMGFNPHLEVLVLNGYYDLATPYLATEYTVDHLHLDDALRDQIHMKYYDAGHMMYLRKPSLEKFKADIAAFIDDTDRL